MAKNKEPVLEYMRGLLDKNGYKDIEVVFKESKTDVFSVGRTVDNKYTVEVGGRILDYTTTEIKDTLIEPIILLHVQFKDKCDQGFASKHWTKHAKKLGYKALRKPVIKKSKSIKNIPIAEHVSCASDKPSKPSLKPNTLKPLRREEQAGNGAEEADSVTCKLKMQTAQYDMGEYRIVRFKSQTVKAYNSKGVEVKAMGFLKAINSQYGFGLKTEGTNTRSLGKKLIEKLKLIDE